MISIQWVVEIYLRSSMWRLPCYTIQNLPQPTLKAHNLHTHITLQPVVASTTICQHPWLVENVLITSLLCECFHCLFFYFCNHGFSFLYHIFSLPINFSHLFYLIYFYIYLVIFILFWFVVLKDETTLGHFRLLRYFNISFFLFFFIIHLFKSWLVLKLCIFLFLFYNITPRIRKIILFICIANCFSIFLLDSI